MTILFTGASGFLGRHVLRTLLKHKWRVTAVARCSSDLVHENLKWKICELRDISIEDMAECDTVLHLAARGVSPRICTWASAFETNVYDSISLWEKAIQAGVKRIIVAGTAFEYGQSANEYEFIPADAPLKPVGAYGASKAAASVALRALISRSSCKGILIRPFNLYGDGAPAGSLWAELLASAARHGDLNMTSGTQVRDFLEVRCAAEKFIDAITGESPTGILQIKNIGSGAAKSVAQFATESWAQLGAPGRIIFGAIQSRHDEITRLVPDLSPVYIK